MIGTPHVTPEGEVFVTPGQAAWLARVTHVTIRRWVARGLIAWVSHESEKWLSLTELQRVAAKNGAPLLPVEILSMSNEEMSTAVRAASHDSAMPDVGFDPPLQALSDLEAAVRDLTAQRDEAIIDRDKARADAEAIDQATMSYRDAWRRATQPY